MRRILLSMMTIALVAVVGVTATRALFSDTETSEGNSFVAGALDLKVDSTAHYDGMICVETKEPGVYEWISEGEGSSAYPELLGTRCSGSWELRDIDSMNDNRFFDYSDIKPGDWGENTLSLHLDSNDAWVRAVVTVTRDSDENGVDGDYDGSYNLYPYGIIEPEDMVDGKLNGSDGTTDGDLDKYLVFTIWKDDGDNILEEGEEILLKGTADEIGSGVSWDLGKLEAGTTHYLGVGWEVPAETGNIIQSDSYAANIMFEAEQVRHNPTPSWNLPTPAPAI